MLEAQQQISPEETNPLHIICMDDKIHSVKHLKTYLSNIPEKDLYKVVNKTNVYGMTPLHICTNDEFMRVLIKNGADVDIRNKYGASVMYKFITSENYKMIQYVIKNGIKSLTMLHSAVHSHMYDLLSVLIDTKLYSNEEIENAFKYSFNTGVNYASSGICVWNNMISGPKHTILYLTKNTSNEEVLDFINSFKLDNEVKKELIREALYTIVLIKEHGKIKKAFLSEKKFKKNVLILIEKYKKDTFVRPTEVRTTVETYDGPIYLDLFQRYGRSRAYNDRNNYDL